MDILDPESDSVRSCTYVEEADELQEIVQKVVATGGQSSGELLARFNTIVRALTQPADRLDQNLINTLTWDANCSWSSIKNKETCWIHTWNKSWARSPASFEIMH